SGLGGIVVAVTATPSRWGVEPSMAAVGGAFAPPAAGFLKPDLQIASGGTSAFFESPLDTLLRRLGRNDLIIAGWGLEGPVHSTLRSANDRGYECLLVPDASIPLVPELAAAASEMVRFSGGIFGAFAESNDVLTALTELSDARRVTERKLS
ncbi:MAG: cysteine hydrolase, partial [Acidimicrobiaceae bacterium]|nr:cysteine hydrolase [Acidimicrobiaceae bacterium]